jgi:DMSO/TMAO reductase YedYZ molybdopterin-dependent catalytic subunit
MATEQPNQTPATAHPAQNGESEPAATRIAGTPVPLWPTLHLGRPPAGIDLTKRDQWELVITGEGLRGAERLTLGELQRDFPEKTIRVVMECIAGWRQENLEWKGVTFWEVLRRLSWKKEQNKAELWAILESVDGYTAAVPFSQLIHTDSLLAWGSAEEPLAILQGGPLRAVFPHLYGWKSVKWLGKIEFCTRETAKARGFWETRGYHLRGLVGKEERGDAWLPKRARRKNAPMYLLPTAREIPEVIVITSDWNDGVSTGLAECARTLLDEMREAEWRCKIVGPCAAQPEYVRTILSDPAYARSPVFFFLHGRASPYRLLGQQRSEEDQEETILVQQGKDEDLFCGRLVYGMSCFSSQILANVPHATVIGFKKGLRVLLKDSGALKDLGRWKYFREPILEGARRLLQGDSASQALAAMRERFLELCRRPRREEHSVQQTTSDVALTMIFMQLRNGLELIGPDRRLLAAPVDSHCPNEPPAEPHEPVPVVAGIGPGTKAGTGPNAVG